MQRRAVRVIRRAADQIFGDVEVHPARLAEPRDYFAHFGHDLGANAIAGQDQKGRVRHRVSP